MTREKSANMPLTLEQHFRWLAEQNTDVQELYSLWLLLRKDLEEQLPLSRGVFVHYSLHDATHSRSVIHAIERFLGDDRIGELSATDTFMLLCCAYAHDYGMALTFNQIYDALGDDNFEKFLQEQEKNDYTLGQEEVQAVRNLLNYIKECKSSTSLQELYFAITTVIQMYLRPTHWKRVNSVWEEFKGLLGGRLSMRFIQGGEGIIDICEAHGKSFDAVMKMHLRADGIVGDNYHPRLIAAMLRLGDLLDLDNGRFPRWFVDEIARNRSLIPELSKLHYQKHESVSHLLITPKRIEVCASCGGVHGYSVADLVSEWLEWLTKECKEQILHWSEITQPDFGRPPMVTKSEILVNGEPYISDNRKLQMRMSQDRVMKLLEGTSIYQDQYVGIRELLQNAVDASLLQLWNDIKLNRYINLRVSKHGHYINKEGMEVEDKKKKMRILEHSKKVIGGIFGNYDITVELILDRVDERIYVVVKDKGIGITPQDVKYISDIGSSKEKNERTLEITRDMPPWLKPSGVFGIGLQSVFQLTDRIEFYTRRPNEPERVIIFHSYGRNYGKIEIREMPKNVDGIYNDNAVPGTNVKITIDPKKMLNHDRRMEGGVNDYFQYYDLEFDQADILYTMFVELTHIISEKLEETPCDYFNVYFQTIQRLSADKYPVKEKAKHPRCSYFSPTIDPNTKDKREIELEKLTILPFFNKKNNEKTPFSFTESQAYFIDEDQCRIHRLVLRPCTIRTENECRVLDLPSPTRDLYHIQYKFNPISNIETIYPQSVRKLRNVHAGFLDWYINIMDDNPTKYLNIDRDRLREGAILEEELTDVRAEILQHWCDYLIKQNDLKKGHRLKKEKIALAKHKNEGTEDQFKPERIANFFAGKPQVFVSIALLFYQNISTERFQRFIKPYEKFIEQQGLNLRGEDFNVERLWEDNLNFYSVQQYPIQVEEGREEEKKNDGLEQLLHLETIWRLPHRLIHIFSISRNGKGELRYDMKLGPASSSPCAIEMDYYARLLDYIGVLDVAFVNGKDSDTTALVRRVFKPNGEFKNLIVNRYPKNFKRGQNFSSSLDHCIRWYILSPFDRDMCKWIKKAVTRDPRDDKLIIGEAKSVIDEYIKKSKYFEKCIKYVAQQHQVLAQAGLNEGIDEIEYKVKIEYREFMIDCYKILIEQKQVIKEYFTKIEQENLSGL